MSRSLTHHTVDVSRRDFTSAEILRLQDEGILSEDDDFELVEGEIVWAQPKTHLHELIKISLTIALARASRSPLDGCRKFDVSLRSLDPGA